MDNTLRLWDLANRQCIHTLKGHTGGVKALAITPDGRYALSAAGKPISRGLRVVSTETGQELVLPFVPQEHALRLWDLDTGKCLRVFASQTSWILTLAITPDGRFALSGHPDKTLRLWDLGSGRCLRRPRPHRDLR